jgi:hypothetical protein
VAIPEALPFVGVRGASGTMSQADPGRIRRNYLFQKKFSAMCSFAGLLLGAAGKIPANRHNSPHTFLFPPVATAFGGV